MNGTIGHAIGILSVRHFVRYDSNDCVGMNFANVGKAIIFLQPGNKFSTYRMQKGQLIHLTLNLIHPSPQACHGPRALWGRAPRGGGAEAMDRAINPCPPIAIQMLIIWCAPWRHHIDLVYE